MNPATSVALGALAGVVFFWAQEAKIPRDQLCVYYASPRSPNLTDLVTWAVMGTMAYRGYVHKDSFVTFFGAAATMVHVAQVLRLTRP